MKSIKVKIQGTSPLIINRFRDVEIEGKSKKKSGEQKEVPIEDKLYLLNGKPYIPSVYLERCLTDAGKRLQIRGKGKSTYSKLVGSTVEVQPQAIPLKQEYKPFRISAVNPMTGGRMMVTRPIFEKWELEYTIILNDEGIGPETMNELLTDAGKYTGIGDWRPEKKGRYGKFIVTEFKEEKQK